MGRVEAINYVIDLARLAGRTSDDDVRELNSALEALGVDSTDILHALAKRPKP